MSQHSATTSVCAGNTKTDKPARAEGARQGARAGNVPVWTWGGLLHALPAHGLCTHALWTTNEGRLRRVRVRVRILNGHFRPGCACTQPLARCRTMQEACVQFVLAHREKECKRAV
eukprot:1144000-Pelagomonas_calceolata.AAC.1